MVKFSKIFAYFVFFMLAVVYFVPKLNFYYYIESKLQNYKVVVSENIKQDNGFFLKLKGVNVFYNGANIAKADNINLKVFCIYNSLNIKNIELSSVVSSFIPKHIQKVNIKYTILNPLNIIASADGDFGKAYVGFNILDKNLTINLTPSKLMLQKHKHTLNSFSKIRDNEYRYVKTF